MGSKTPQYLIDKCRSLRIEKRLTLQEIMVETGLGKGTVYSYIKDLPFTAEERAARGGSASHTPEATAKRRDTWRKKLDERGFDGVGFDRKRFLIIEEQNGTCNHCGLSEWRGQPICLEIDHKNGDNCDHRRDNMEAICPNCHAMTDTWRGRNKRSSKAVTDSEILKALDETKNIRQALLRVGLAAKGGNYLRAQRLRGDIE